MTRIALALEYSGHPFFGWQRQADKITVQSTFEKALSQVADENILVTASGRTDTGVHALSQIIHFDTTAKRSEDAWILGVNSLLPSSIRIHYAKTVSDEFHARYSAISRRYQYFILNRQQGAGVFSEYVTSVKQKLNLANMQKAAACFIGKHDFTSFRSGQCQAKTPVREVFECALFQEGEFIIFDISANAFLHHMIRNMVACLLDIGRGDKDPTWAEEVLRACDLTLNQGMAKPNGLYLTDVEYPSSFDLPRLSSSLRVTTLPFALSLGGSKSC